MEFLIFLVFVGLIVLFAMRSSDRERLRALEHQVEQIVTLSSASPAAVPMPARGAAAPRSTPAPAVHVPVPAVPEPAGSFGTFAEQPAEDSPPWPASGPRTRSRLERVVAEHALAIVGGLFVLVAAVLFVSFAIDQGWIGARTKFALAVGLGAVLVAAALRVARRLPASERRGRALGSLHGVLAGTGVGVCFIAIVAAVRVQELFSAPVGVMLEVAAAAAAVQLARRWRSQDLAAFGIAVAVAAPALVGAQATGATIALLAVAIIGAAVIAVLELWPRLLVAVTLLSAPQLASFAGNAETTVSTVIAVAVVWWGVLLAAAAAASLRSAEGTSRSAISTVFAASAAAAGLVALSAGAQSSPADTQRWSFLAVFALAHVLAGLIVLRNPALRLRLEGLATALLGAGGAVGAFAIADATGGSAVTAGLAAEAVALGALWWALRSRITAAFAAALAATAIGHAVWIDAPLELLVTPTRSVWEPALALVSIVIAAVAARVLQRRITGREGDSAPHVVRADRATARTLEFAAAACAWYLGAMLLVRIGGRPGVDHVQAADWLLGGWAAAGALTCAWVAGLRARAEWWGAAALLGLTELALLVGPYHPHLPSLWVLVPALAVAVAAASTRLSPVRSRGGLIALGSWQLALVAVVVLERVSPDNLRTFSADPRLTAVALASLLAASAGAVAWVVLERSGWGRPARRAATVIAAVAGLYAVSIAVVALFTREPGQFDQAAQVALTLTWVVLGVAALLVGTSRRLRRFAGLRVGAYALLALAAAKLVLADTTDLEIPLRVLAFLATGLALLGSAALEQRLRD